MRESHLHFTITLSQRLFYGRGLLRYLHEFHLMAQHLKAPNKYAHQIVSEVEPNQTEIK